MLENKNQLKKSNNLQDLEKLTNQVTDDEYTVINEKTGNPYSIHKKAGAIPQDKLYKEKPEEDELPIEKILEELRGSKEEQGKKGSRQPKKNKEDESGNLKPQKGSADKIMQAVFGEYQKRPDEKELIPKRELLELTLLDGEKKKIGIGSKFTLRGTIGKDKGKKLKGSYKIVGTRKIIKGNIELIQAKKNPNDKNEKPLELTSAQFEHYFNKDGILFTASDKRQEVLNKTDKEKKKEDEQFEEIRKKISENVEKIAKDTSEKFEEKLKAIYDKTEKLFNEKERGEIIEKNPEQKSTETKASYAKVYKKSIADKKDDSSWYANIKRKIFGSKIKEREATENKTSWLPERSKLRKIALISALMGSTFVAQNNKDIDSQQKDAETTTIQNETSDHIKQQKEIKITKAYEITRSDLKKNEEEYKIQKENPTRNKKKILKKEEIELDINPETKKEKYQTEKENTERIEENLPAGSTENKTEVGLGVLNINYKPKEDRKNKSII